MRTDLANMLLRKIIAGFLFILTALPFTAPFATCDMPTLLGKHVPALHKTAVMPSVEDGSRRLFASGAQSGLKIVSRAETDATAIHIASPAPHLSGSETAAPLLPDRVSLTALRI
jgi:hypothetical protein